MKADGERGRGLVWSCAAARVSPLRLGRVGRARRQQQVGEPGRSELRATRLGAVEGAHRPGHVRPHALALCVLTADVAIRDGAVELPALDLDRPEEDLGLVVDVAGLGLGRWDESRAACVRAVVGSLRPGDPECLGRHGRRLLLRRDAAAGRDSVDRQGHHQEAQENRADDVLGGFKDLLHCGGLPTISSIRHYGCRVARCSKHRDLNFQISFKVRR